MIADPNEPSAHTFASFALMEAEPSAVFRYWRLAVETSHYVKSLHSEGALRPGPSWFDIEEASSVGYILMPVKSSPEAREFIVRWQAWDAEYRQIYARSPKWRLKEMISQISETHHCIGWPQRWERDVWEWSIADLPDGASPFADRAGVIDADFHKRIRDLVVQSDGFLYRCEERGQILFCPTADLPRIWRHQDHLAEIDRQKPFGFFNDMSRPNWQEFTRDLTNLEQRMREAGRPTRWARWRRQFRRQLRNIVTATFRR